MRIPEHIRTTITLDGAVLLNIKGAHMVALNPIASIVWQQLCEGRSLEEISIRLADDFGISRDLALADVNEFVQQLETQNLIDPLVIENTREKPESWLRHLIHNLVGGREFTANSNDPPTK